MSATPSFPPIRDSLPPAPKTFRWPLERNPRRDQTEIVPLSPTNYAIALGLTIAAAQSGVCHSMRLAASPVLEEVLLPETDGSDKRHSVIRVMLKNEEAEPFRARPRVTS